MTTLKTEVIILHVLDFRDSDQILTTFTLEEGMMKFVRKWGQNSKGKQNAAPLTRAEIVYQQRNSDLLKCLDLTVYSHHREIRDSLEALEAAGRMVQAIRRTQFPGKPAPLLFQLFAIYLEHLGRVKFPQTLASSFLLKLLRHDGLIGNLGICSNCGAGLKDLYLLNGEGFCQEHHGANSILVPAEQLETLQLLLYSQELSKISNTPTSPELNETIWRIFEGICSY